MSSTPQIRSKTLNDRFNAETANLFAALSESPTGLALMDTMGGSVNLEAIIIADQFKRPALLVRNNTYEPPQSSTWRSILDPQRSKLEAAIRSVGRVELTGHPTLPYAGTGWMIADNIAVTNRHVASIFGRRQGASFGFRDAPLGGKFKARIDFREEFNIPSTNEIEVEKILFIADDGDAHADVALLKLRGSKLPNPIELADSRTRQGQPVVVIGYPANDPRNPAAAVADIFGDVFEVKRMSPGEISGNPRGFVVNHDCSTLGGNSGAVVLDIESGKAVGLHFGGRFRVNNLAVEAGELKKILSKLKIQISVPPIPEKPKAKKSAAIDLSDREGYIENFLGTKPALRVPLPELSESQQASLAPVKGAGDGVLRYTHFSIAMNASRRFAYYTACNIDGKTSTNIRRANDNWLLDPRIADGHQVGNELYRNNDLDRGHLVRRLDPVWGKADEAQRANDDTFYYTNSTPQHARLNQGNWNDLEDYILTNTDAENLRVCVFTGPVFGDDDPEYRDVFLPQAYWKVVTVVNGHSGKLHATAYMLSQRDLLTDLEFVFGQFRTYQVPISEVEDRTGLSFGKLRKADPLRDQESFAVREITKLDEIVL
jgi:endonuclease G